MDYFAGLDVSVKDTSVCVVDDTGKIVREVKDRIQRATGVLSTVHRGVREHGLACGDLHRPARRSGRVG